jgi:hypothetical protein
MLLGGCTALCAAAPQRTVEAAIKPGEPWKAFPTRALEDLPPLTTSPADLATSSYGGIRQKQVEPTGFFYATKKAGRWWLVDPEGCPFIYRGVSSVKTISSRDAEAALKKVYGSRPSWARGTATLLTEHGFNGVGAWSDNDELRQVTPHLVYTLIWNFMSSYGKERGGTFQQPGHTGYPSDCIFVFDPEFEGFCDRHARQLLATKDDPWLLGHFSDNELPFKRETLRNYLSLPVGDPGFQAAREWLQARHGAAATVNDVTPRDEEEFLGYVADRYFRIVSGAIKRHDPSHLYLGARVHGASLRFPEVFRAAGPYVDVMSVNYYRAWTPSSEHLEMWEREAGKPVLITEWYAKGEDSGLANTSGAGWLVKTQRDRGLFYQNFTLALLESRVCVGWDWFKYIDNDPAATGVDPSNVDSNKGIVSNRYQPYEPMLGTMKELNDRILAIVEHFDGRTAPPPGVRLLGERGD